MVSLRCPSVRAIGLAGDGSALKRQDCPRCGARNRQGLPCAVRVKPGKTRCRFHGGLSTGPRTAEGRQRIASAQRRRWELFRERNERSSVSAQSHQNQTIEKCHNLQQIQLLVGDCLQADQSDFPNDFENPSEVKHGAVGWQRSQHLRIVHLDRCAFVATPRTTAWSSMLFLVVDARRRAFRQY
jgi:hypothetical protein